jgi:predicted  nucleic acid-binding Zn-ribbon protein
VSSQDLETLLLVQEQDIALDRLRHRRASLPERAELDARLAEHAAREREATTIRARREEVYAEEHRIDAEAQALGARAAEMDQRLYSGTVTSPRELQAMQADVDMLRRHRGELEDTELVVMEEREALDKQLADLDAEMARLGDEIARLRATIAGVEAEIDAEAAHEEAERAKHASALPEGLVADYERRRQQNRGAGAARLVGVTCQACHLSIPSTEAERIRRAAGETVAYCDNCSAILVP